MSQNVTIQRLLLLLVPKISITSIIAFPFILTFQDYSINVATQQESLYFFYTTFRTDSFLFILYKI